MAATRQTREQEASQRASDLRYWQVRLQALSTRLIEHPNVIQVLIPALVPMKDGHFWMGLIVNSRELSVAINQCIGEPGQQLALLGVSSGDNETYIYKRLLRLVALPPERTREYIRRHIVRKDVRHGLLQPHMTTP